MDERPIIIGIGKLACDQITNGRIESQILKVGFCAKDRLHFRRFERTKIGFAKQ